MQTGSFKWLLALAICAGVSACGDTTAEQAIFGAGTGALGAAAVDGDLATGVLVGAAANVAYCNKYPWRCN